MARAIAENFDYVFRNALYFVHQSRGFINPEPHIEACPELQFAGLYSQGCTFWASTYFQNWTSVDVNQIRILHKLILRELSENKLEKIWYNKQTNKCMARNHDNKLGRWRGCQLRAWLWHCMCVCVCDTTVLIICSSAAAAEGALLCCRVLLWHSHSLRRLASIKIPISSRPKARSPLVGLGLPPRHAGGWWYLGTMLHDDEIEVSTHLNPFGP